MASRVIQGRFLRASHAVGGRIGTGASMPLQPPKAGQPATALQRQSHTVEQRAAAGGAFRVDENVLRLHGPGRQLPDALRMQMETALDTDFTAVRVHVGPQAQSIGAIAFTIGNDIYFAPGQYSPDTAPGRHLIGHELAHVVQQRQGRVRNPFNTGVAVVQDQMLEAEADRLGAQAAARLPAGGTKPADCRCKGNCGGSPPPNHWSLQRKGVVQRMDIESSIAFSKPVRSSVAEKYLKHGHETRSTDKFRLALGGKEQPVKKKIVCQAGSRPRAPNWQNSLWDSTSNYRPGWTFGLAAQQAYYNNACPGYRARAGNCVNVTAAIDHDRPWKFYITENADFATFCDGHCHFWGVRRADAVALCSNDDDVANGRRNLRGLCAVCNGLKAVDDRALYQVTDFSIWVQGACPGGNPCGADVIL